MSNTKKVTISLTPEQQEKARTDDQVIALAEEMRYRSRLLGKVQYWQK